MADADKDEQRKTANRIYKSRIFEMIFSDRKALLELYNAVNRTQYADPEALTINTLENVIYLSMHNDISFLIDSRLSLYEHQSTYSPNLPLRYLLYVSELYAGMAKGANIYGRKKVELPPPRFLVFYNGQEDQPERKEMRLSGLYAVQEEEPWLELRAELVNINRGMNRELMDTCRTLRDYAEYTARVREYRKGLPLEEAVEKAITECIREGILAEFLSRNRAEAKRMSIYEYDEESVMQMLREEAREEGRLEGQIEFLLNTLRELGNIPDCLREKIQEETDTDVLNSWMKLAARASSLEEFAAKFPA